MGELGEPDRYDPFRGYEAAIAQWGWTHRYIEDELTDELFVHLLDASADRITHEFANAVEAARMGAVFATNGRAYGRWRQKVDRVVRRTQRGLTGAALEAAVMRVAAIFPDNVIHETRAG